MTTILGVFFDQDGVIVDTERDGHRVAFNQAFREFGFAVEWDVDKYQELLKVAGGKERLKYFLHTEGFGTDVPPQEEDELIRALHERKTDIFIEILETGRLPLRPGVRRLMREAVDAGLTIGICTTSNRRSAQAVAAGTLKDIEVDFVLAGDVVDNKKPDPEIYLLALQTAGLKAEEAVVIEDSRQGTEAAKAAGLRVVATPSFYTRNEDLSIADVIVTNLGEPGGQKGELLKGLEGTDYDGVLNIRHLEDYFSRISRDV